MLFIFGMVFGLEEDASKEVNYGVSTPHLKMQSKHTQNVVDCVQPISSAPPDTAVQSALLNTLRPSNV